MMGLAHLGEMAARQEAKLSHMPPDPNRLANAGTVLLFIGEKLRALLEQCRVRGTNTREIEAAISSLEATHRDLIWLHDHPGTPLAEMARRVQAAYRATGQALQLLGHS